MSHVLDIEHIRNTLDTRRIGWRIEYFPETASTNCEAWRLVESEAREPGHDGLVVLAEHQTAGRGRLGRTWHSPRGASLLCSIVVTDRDRRFRGDEVMLLCAVAACDAVAKATSVKPRIKWPNDLIVNQRKLGGILIETKSITGVGRTFVCGIGINCLQQRGHLAPEISATATSLELESALPVDRTRVATKLLKEFDVWLGAVETEGVEVLRGAWLHRCEPMGQHIRLRCRGETYSGTTVDIDPSAALVIQLDTGHRRAFSAADTTILAPDTH